MKLVVALGAGHGGFTLKNDLIARLREIYEILDLGAQSLVQLTITLTSFVQ